MCRALGSVHVLLAGAGGGVRFQAISLDFFFADLANAINPVLDFVEAGPDVVVALLECFYDRDVVFIAFDRVGYRVLVRLGDVAVRRRGGFPVGRVVWVHTADFFQLLFNQRFFLLELILKVIVIYGHVG
jgi:hypothetical protein